VPLTPPEPADVPGEEQYFFEERQHISERRLAGIYFFADYIFAGAHIKILTVFNKMKPSLRESLFVSLI
jgi:hypothetical protein